MSGIILQVYLNFLPTHGTEAKYIGWRNANDSWVTGIDSEIEHTASSLSGSLFAFHPNW